ncbi:hypothetical protein SELMODRAFT_91574 [Selaginella moellendorffii]|uniref:DDE Tnp4 domain-containing protein n=1 Tax=Selaginella moellendorffii TaxID=88036 RepID=D8REB3_SELML|nr:hypothetical protein SELMODRAFT_91574 [Selaginella moellendorffii]
MQNPTRWREFFRVFEEQFMTICKLVAPSMQKNIPSRYVPVGKQVVIALWRLASGDSFASLAEHFGVSKTTVWKYCQKFSNTTFQHLGQFLAWPANLSAVKTGFKSLCGFPNCCGAIDCTHFEVELPGNAFASDYYNKDKDYSIVMQAIVDSEARFLEI